MKFAARQSKPGVSGYLLILVLIFGGVFFTLATSFVSYIVTQSKVIDQRVELQRAADIAEAGLNYYRWYLAHYPNDTTNGTGLAGPYVHQYLDPELGAIGEFALTITSSTFCGDIASIEVTSTGYTYADPTITRTFTARYSRPTVAEYSFIINANVWAGPTRVIVGPYHSNGGIRMDGQNNSTVSSGQATWSCTATFGCSPTVIRNGVFTTTLNANPALFTFPAAPINFTGLSVDLSVMQDKAINNGGIYIGPSGSFGYRVTFNNNDTISVRRVTNTTQYWGFSNEDGQALERHVISNTAAPTTHNINASCPLIFVQDKVWLDGVVNGKVSLAAADVSSPTINPSIILNGNITYTSPVTSGLLAIAEQDVLVGVSVPNNMTANGIFIAQNGRFGRNHYVTAGMYALPGGLAANRFRDSLTMNGTIVSNGRVGTQWTSGAVPQSGFLVSNNTYDRNLVSSPPPLIPKTSDVYRMTDWREVQ